MPIIKLFISSKQWKNAKIQDYYGKEYVKMLIFREDEFFFEDDRGKLSINFGFGSIKLPSKLFKKQLDDYLESKRDFKKWLKEREMEIKRQPEKSQGCDKRHNQGI